MKVVDLVSFGQQPRLMMLALLEISLWHRVTQEFDLFPDEITAVLATLETPGATLPSSVGWKASVMWEVLKALREGAIGASEEMLCLVYAFQALVHQRFVLQGTAGGVSVGLLGVSAHWMSRLRRLAARMTLPDQTAPALSYCTVSASAPVLLSLWRRTLISKDFASLDESADRFVRHLWETSPDLMQSPLTDLQRRVFDSAINPFHSESHVILSAPTNSGKSTAAEMFL